MCPGHCNTLSPSLELNFVSKDGTLEIPLTGAIDKVDKFRCLANTAILRIVYLYQVMIVGLSLQVLAEI